MAWVRFALRLNYQNTYNRLKYVFIEKNPQHIKFLKLALFYLFNAHEVLKIGKLKIENWKTCLKMLIIKKIGKKILVIKLFWLISNLLYYNYAKF